MALGESTIRRGIEEILIFKTKSLIIQCVYISRSKLNNKLYQTYISLLPLILGCSKNSFVPSYPSSHIQKHIRICICTRTRFTIAHKSSGCVCVGACCPAACHCGSGTDSGSCPLSDTRNQSIQSSRWRWSWEWEGRWHLLSLFMASDG